MKANYFLLVCLLSFFPAFISDAWYSNNNNGNNSLSSISYQYQMVNKHETMTSFSDENKDDKHNDKNGRRQPLDNNNNVNDQNSNHNDSGHHCHHDEENECHLSVSKLFKKIKKYLVRLLSYNTLAIVLSWTFSIICTNFKR